MGSVSANQCCTLQSTVISGVFLWIPLWLWVELNVLPDSFPTLNHSKPLPNCNNFSS